jgi:hypothetical protein
VGAGWFEISLPSLQMRGTDAVPVADRAKAEFTLNRLNQSMCVARCVAKSDISSASY